MQTSRLEMEPRRYRGNRRRLSEALVGLPIIAYVLFLLLPLLWSLMTAFKPSSDYLTNPPTFIPTDWTLVHFQTLGRLRAWDAVLNSLIVSIGTTVLAVVFGFLAGYGFSRFRAGGRVFAYALILQRLLPPVVFLVPSFIIFSFFGLVDTHLALVIAYAAGSTTFATWIIASFLTLVPRDYEEAALIDGASKRQLLWHVVLPLARPAVIAAGGFTFVVGWTEFLFALILTRNNRTLPAIFPSFVGAEASLLGELGALAIIAAVPAIVLGALFYRYAVMGLAMGGVKG